MPILPIQRIQASILYVFLGCVLLCGCEKKKPPAQVPSISVSVVKVEPKTVPANYEYVGIVESSHEVEIRARVTGYLDAIGYIEGSFVSEGDLLFQLDPRPFQATLAQDQALVANQQAVLWQAQRAVARYRPLYEQKAASQRDLDNALASEMSAEAQLLAAQAQVASAEINLGYTTIRSPVSGLAGQAKYRVGSLISPDQDLMTTVSVINPIWVVFSVSEQDILQSQVDRQKGRVVFPPNDNFSVELVLADQSFFAEKGKVNFTSPVFSSKTGTMMIRATLPNPNNLLRPGQFVRVKILGAERPNAILVPQRAVVQSSKGTLVFIVNEEGKAEARPIDPGPWDGNDWVIYDGLKAGDKVIVDGVNKVLPGSPVTIKEEPPKEGAAAS